jgi:hypothetical protein
MNKLDAFNNDKRKCKKCKDYYDEKTSRTYAKQFLESFARERGYTISSVLCEGCYVKWSAACDNWVPDRSVLSPKFEDWCNNEQT